MRPIRITSGPLIKKEVKPVQQFQRNMTKITPIEKT